MNKPEDRKNAYNRDELELCGTGGLFGSDTGKLPTGNMLMFDRIIEINDDGGKLFYLAITVFILSAIVLFHFRSTLPIIGKRFAN